MAVTWVGIETGQGHIELTARRITVRCEILEASGSVGWFSPSEPMLSSAEGLCAIFGVLVGRRMWELRFDDQGRKPKMCEVRDT